MVSERAWTGRLRVRVAAALATAAALAVACNGVLGIGSAQLDPSVGVDAGVDAGTPCDQYCTTIMRNCTGQNLEYLDIGVCEAMCKHLEPGTATDETQDTLACRNYHANAAAGDPDFHCRHAGPLGGLVCGTDLCAPFCLLDFDLCQELTPYDGGELGCETACTAAAFPYLTIDAGDIQFPTGNTFNCRLYHLESAYEPDNDQARSTHCPHTGVVSATCF
jgi:hypothetical protein